MAHFLSFQNLQPHTLLWWLRHPAVQANDEQPEIFEKMKKHYLNQYGRKYKKLLWSHWADNFWNDIFQFKAIFLKVLEAEDKIPPTAHHEIYTSSRATPIIDFSLTDKIRSPCLMACAAAGESSWTADTKIPTWFPPITRTPKLPAVWPESSWI